MAKIFMLRVSHRNMKCITMETRLRNDSLLIPLFTLANRLNPDGTLVLKTVNVNFVTIQAIGFPIVLLHGICLCSVVFGKLTVEVTPSVCLQRKHLGLQLI